MTATISFELKPVMKHLSKDDRWNFLTALLLHANIRNRAYPSMQTLADMATNGNLHKATDAKKWLEKHGAFELVAYGKRVDDEKLCGKRQHIYQLLGVLKGCGDPECDCWQTGEYRYLYFNKQGVPDIAPVDNITTGNVVPTDNITDAEIVDGDNIKAADIAPIDNVNGYKGSITKETKDSKDLKEKTAAKTPHPRKSNPYDDVPGDTRKAIIAAWLNGLPEKPTTNEYEKTTNQNLAAGIARAGYCAADVERYVQAQYQDKFWQGKFLPLSNVATNVGIWIKGHPPIALAKTVTTNGATPKHDPHAAEKERVRRQNEQDAIIAAKKASGQ